MLGIKEGTIKMSELNNQSFDMTSAMELAKAKREMFLAARTQHEIAIKAWAEKISKVDKSKLEGIELPEDISLRTFMPEAYEDNPNQEVCDQQFEAMMKLFGQINEIAIKYNQRALQELQDYNAFQSNIGR